MNFKRDVLLEIFPLCAEQVSCPFSFCVEGIPHGNASRHLAAELMKTTLGLPGIWAYGEVWPQRNGPNRIVDRSSESPLIGGSSICQ